MVALAWGIVFIAGMVIASLAGAYSTLWSGFFWISVATESFVLVFLVVTLLPNLAVTVRRLHDTGRSGWCGLLVLIWIRCRLPSELTCY